MMRSKTFIAALAVAAMAHVAAARASILYVTDGDASRLAIVDTTAGTLLSTATTQPGQYPIAVSSTVWLGNYDGSSASEYALNGVATGVTAPATAVGATDGTTDGTVNYELGNAFSDSGTVYKANKDWTDPVALFDTVSGSDLVGIAYAAASRSLWVSDTATIYQYSLTGTLLSQFSKSSSRGSLAYDPSSDTLWFVANASNTISQYSTSGTLLNSESISGLSSNNWGAEFAIDATPVPEPGTMAILGAALASLGFMRKRRTV